MTDLATGQGGRTTDDGGPPGPAQRALRPFGYLLIGLVWLVIWVAAILIPIGSVAYLAFDDPEAVVENWSGMNPFGAAAAFLLLVPLMALIMGPGALWHLPTASWPLMVLSFTYVVRSLRPSYGGEKLSFTSWLGRGSSIGLPTVGSVSMSLQPVRQTRFTDVVMKFYVAGWSLDGRMFLAMLPAGVAWTTAVIGILPGLSPAVHALFLTLTALLLLTSVVLGMRAFRSRFRPGTEPATRRSGGGGELTPEERARRLARFHEKQRAKRAPGDSR
jgi:hypothetical protein